MKKILFITVLFISIFSCKKDDDRETQPEPNNNFVSGVVDIPENYTNSDIQILCNGGKYDIDENGNFQAPESDVVYAVEKNTYNVIYFTYTEGNLTGKTNKSGESIKLNAEETAISFGITFSLPASYIPSSTNYSEKITELKELIRNLPSFPSLVNVIEDEVSNPASDLVLHLKDELLQLWTDARECGGDFFDGLNETENPMGLSDEVLSEINNDFPYFRYKSSQNGTIKLEHTNSTFNSTTNKWVLNITLFNETPLYLGAVVGSKTGVNYIYDAENIENILAPYNTSELLKDFTDCNAYGEFLSGIQHLYNGETSSITLFATQKDFIINVDETDNFLIVFSPQNSTRLTLYTLLQGIIKQSSVFTKVFYSKLSENDDLKSKKEKLLSKLVQKASQDDDVIQSLFVLSNEATLENLQELSLDLWDVIQEFITDNLFTDVILKSITEQVFPYDEYKDLPNAFLTEYKLYKKLVEVTADQIDILMLLHSWQRYNGGVAFECVLPSSLPTITTTAISSITESTATSGGNVTDDGGSSVTAKGVCWSTSPNPTTADNITNDGTGTGSFTSSLTGLTENTTYYVRAYATNSIDTSYGDELEFTTTSLETSSFTDARDGKTYSTVKIGDQWWMSENLAYNYAGSFAYDDNESNVDTYGRLYNKNSLSEICPEGWRVPSRSDYLTLSNYLNGEVVPYFTNQGGKLKETGTTHWNSPNTGATNESGFTAIAGGWKDNTGNYNGLGEIAYFWTSTTSQGDNIQMYLDLTYDSEGIHTAYWSVGYRSCRCIQE